MSVYSVPVTIGVDEERIAKEIEKDVMNKVVDNITENIEGVMFEMTYYNKKSDEPLCNLVRKQIDKILEEKTDVIVETAANILADRLVRTKVVKEKAAMVIEKKLK